MTSPQKLQAGTAGTLLEQSRRETDKLFDLIAGDDLYVRPLPQRHRLIFYLGHVEAFDWNQVGRQGLSESHVSSTLDDLFSRGIDPEPEQLPQDMISDWPSIRETREYVRKVRERLDSLWDEAPLDFQMTAIEHRLMHAETLAYQLHNLPHEKKLKGPAPAGASLAVVNQHMIRIPFGSATLGRKRGAGFGWDNEFDENAVDVPAFSISKYKITNGEYLNYLNQGHAPPFFWDRINGEWFYRGMFDFTPLPLNAPVYVTQKQATEYATWRGMHLPTEAQYHRAAYGTPEGGELEHPWELNGAPRCSLGNFGFQHWDPVAVTDYASGESAFGVAQLIGNGWEWTRTLFGPFPGFEPRPNYPGYSADFFDNQHFVLKGASPRTAASLTRPSMRNWFRSDYPYVYATFHLVEN